MLSLSLCRLPREEGSNKTLPLLLLAAHSTTHPVIADTHLLISFWTLLQLREVIPPAL